MIPQTPPQSAATASSPPDLASFLSLPVAAAIDRYAIGVENFDRRLLELKDAELDTAFFPEAGVGRWPSRVLVGHLADAELAQVHRMRRTIAEDQPVLSTWDEHAFIDAGLYGSGSAGSGTEHPVAAYVAVLHTLRKWNAPWMRTLTAAQWDRKALHPERGEQTVRFMLGYISWHLEHHAWYLNRKIELLIVQRS